MRVVVVVACIGLLGCEPTISDPCPGQRTCPNSLCCDEQFPYNCGASCYSAPCGPTQVTCIHVDRTDGCYGGKWSGTITGPSAPGSSLVFDIFDHNIQVTSPIAGTGSVDCDTGVGSFTLGSGAITYSFQGTWRHTESQGDRISNANWTAMGSGAMGAGAWDALRIE